MRNDYRFLVDNWAMKKWQSELSGLAGAFIALAVSQALGLNTVVEIFLILICVGIGNTIGARMRDK